MKNFVSSVRAASYSMMLIVAPATQSTFFLNQDGPISGPVNLKETPSKEFQHYACSCSSLTFSANQTSGNGEGCCLNLAYANSGNNCFDSLNFQIGAGQIVSVVPNPGFVITQPNSSSLLVTHSSGTIPSGNMQIGTVCIKPASQFFAISLSYSYTENGILKSCSNTLESRCMAGICDSLNPFADLLRFNPPQCCYRFMEPNMISGTFNSIELNLSSGFFTGVVANTLDGYQSSNAGNVIQYTHSSGVMPGGFINPGSFCISGHQNPFQITVKYLSNIGGKQDTCKFDLINSCTSNTNPDSSCTGALCAPPNTQWSQILPTANYIIYDMEVYHGKLYLAGQFNGIGNQPTARNIASWDGSNWNILGSGPGNGTNGIIYDLEVHNNKLFMGGSFSVAGGVSCNNIASWDDVSGTFASLGTSPNDGVSGGAPTRVSALISYGLDLVVGGQFKIVQGSINSGNIHLWNDLFQTWSPMNFNGGLNGGSVKALHIYNGSLVAGGSFQSPVQGIGIWNGSNWSALNGGIPNNPLLNEGVSALETYNGKLCVGGIFAGTNAPNTKNLAAWDGTNWSDIDLGALSGSEITDLLFFNNELFYAGTPNITLGSPSFMNSVGRLVNNQWTNTLHQAKLAYCLAVYDPPGVKDPCELYAAGELFFDKISCSTATSDPERENQSIQFYPNPGMDRVFITGLLGQDRLEFYNELGNRIDIPCIHLNKSTAEVSLREVSSGFYVALVRNQFGQLVSATKLIKL